MVNYSLFDKLEQKVDKYLSIDQVELIRKAFVTAERAHDGQTRASGEPYITHPVAVACILADYQLDHETIMAGLLHDVVEDTSVTKEQLTQLFNSNVSNLVSGVTKLDKLQFSNYKEAHVANLQKMVMAMVQDIRVIIIKLADRTHNMRTLGGLRADKRRRIAKETLEIYTPIANRLGMYKFKNILEDLCFINLFPMRYHVLKKSISIAINNRKSEIEQIIKDVSEHLNKKGIVSKVFCRDINLFNVYRKLQTKKIAFHSLLDNYCFTVIVKDVDTCYRVLGILHNIYKPKAGFFRDYIAVPKLNGYQSLHSALNGPHGMPIEMLIRTDFMDCMAEIGIAARWASNLKENQNVSAVQQQAQRWMNNLLELKENVGNAFEFVENIKDELFPNEIYVFTQDGTIIELPTGSTAIDFAYAVHSDVGHKCIGARVDHLPYPLSRPLKSGQYVEIMTSPNGRPNTSWLNFVVTAKARSRIKQFLKNMTEEEAIVLGRRLLMNALQNKNLSDIPNDKLQQLLDETNHTNINELYKDIAMGNEMSALIVQRILGDSAFTKNNPLINLSNSNKIAIRGTNGMLVNFANCCQPIPGDNIIGMVSQGKGLVIHNSNCRIIKGEIVKNKNQIINVEWDNSVEQQTFQSTIRIDFSNASAITRITAELGTESLILKMNTEKVDDSNFFMIVTIQIKNKQQLEHVLQKMLTIPDVIQSSRVIDMEQ